MLRTMVKQLSATWKMLVLTDVLFKIIAFVAFTPLISLLFRAFLWMAGHTILADADIVGILLHPIGWLMVVVVGGGAVGILALEQAALMTILLSSAHGKTLTIFGSFHFVGMRATGIFRITASIVVRLFAMASPFLLVGGGVYWLLLTDHDINYYLDQKPPRFWLAVALIGSIVIALTTVLVRAIVGLSVAIQIHLFENVAPRDCLKRSQQRLFGARATITKWIVTWAVLVMLVSSFGSAVVLTIGRWVIPATINTFWALNVTLGFLVLLWSAVNFGSSLLAVISLAALQANVYERFGRSQDFALPPSTANSSSWPLSWTPFRVVTGLVIAVMTACLIGATAMHSIPLEDHVEITAHRGASGKAPENTMASVLQAIEDGTDWVEIDVQETKDGVVIVAHDSDLKKVSGANAKIWNLTAEELRAIDIGSYLGSQFKNERVPTLAEVLAACRGRVRVNIELKYYGHDQDLEKKVVALVEQHDMARHVVIMSLKADGIRKIKQLRPSWTVGLLTAVAIGDVTRADADFLAVKTKLATRSFVRSAHQKQKRVHTWTANDALTLSTMMSRGVDNVITDHPELARQVLADRARMSPVERVLLELAFMFGAAPHDVSEP